MNGKDLHPLFVVEFTPKKELPREVEDAFNKWYKKHFELMLKVPGIVGAYRYVTAGSKTYAGTPTEGEKKYFAFYELTDKDPIDKILSSSERTKALQDPEFPPFLKYFDLKRYVYLPLYRAQR